MKQERMLSIQHLSHHDTELMAHATSDTLDKAIKKLYTQYFSQNDTDLVAHATADTFDEARKKLYTQYLSHYDTEWWPMPHQTTLARIQTLENGIWHKPTFNLHK